MPTVPSGFEPATFLPEVADFSSNPAAENRDAPGTPIGVEHYVGRAGPDPGYVNLPPSTVGIGGPLISPKKANQTATHDTLWLRRQAGRP
jgi:hypothetical protein